MRRTADSKFILKNYQLIFHLSKIPIWNIREYNGSGIRTLVFLFLSNAKYICQIKIHLINLLHLLFRYAFRVCVCVFFFFWWFTFFHKRSWTTVRNIFNKATKMVAVTTSIFKCYQLWNRHKHLRWNFSLIITASSFDQIFSFVKCKWSTMWSKEDTTRIIGVVIATTVVRRNYFCLSLT